MIRNTMGAREYIKLNIFWLITAVIWYKRLVFKKLPDITYFDSLLILWLTVIIFSIISFFFIYERARNGLSIVASIMLPLEIYTIFAYYKFFSVLFTIVLCFAISLVVLYSILFLNIHISNNRNRKKAIGVRINKWVCGSRIILAIMLSALVLPLATKTILNKPLIASQRVIEFEADSDTWTIKNNINELKQLRNSEWQKLSVQEKIDVLQIVANIEARVLGISTKLSLGAKNMSEYTVGLYEKDTDKIYINIDSLADCRAEEALNTICHESYHAYQAKMAEVYNNLNENEKKLKIFKDAQKYAENYDNYYFTGEKYYNQPLEVDAREYAENAVGEYYAKIEVSLKDDYAEETEDNDFDQLIKDAAEYLDRENKS